MTCHCGKLWYDFLNCFFNSPNTTNLFEKNIAIAEAGNNINCANFVDAE